jgi:hypothetical protein
MNDRNFIEKLYNSILNEAFRNLKLDRETVLHKHYGKMSPEEMHKLDMQELEKNKELTKQEQQQENPSKNKRKAWKSRRVKQTFLKMTTNKHYPNIIRKKLGVKLDMKRQERGRKPIPIDIIVNTQHGMSMNFVKSLRDQIEPAKDAITLIISGTGDPPTAWILAHNMAHKLIGNENITDPDYRKESMTPEQGKQNQRQSTQALKDFLFTLPPEKRANGIEIWKKQQKEKETTKVEVPRIIKPINPTLLSILHAYQEAYYNSLGRNVKNLFKTKQGLVKRFYMSVSGFKSVTEDNLQLPVEYLFELMSQYIIQGEVKFLPVPSEEVANYYAKQLTDLFDDVMEEAIGTILWS